MSEAGRLADRTAGPAEAEAGAAEAGAGVRRALRSPRPAALAAAVLFALVVAALVPLSLVARQSPLVNGGESLPAILFGVVGLVIAWRQPRNPIGWLLAGIASCLLLSVDSGFYSVISYRLGHHLPLAPAALFLYELWEPALVLFGVVILLFPDGRLPSRAARGVLRVFVAVLTLFTAALIVAVAQAVGGHHVALDSYDGLVAIDSAVGWYALTQSVFALVGAPFLVWCVARQVLIWRRSSGERRQQLKWLASGVTVAVVGLVLGLLVPSGASAAERAAANVIAFGIVALPVSVGVAVLRYRLYEIDRIISRTLAYAIVTGLLVGVYAGLVLLATQVLKFHSTVAVAAATLVAAALFTPLRRRIQRLVDRRFNRARYDAERTVAAFAARLQDAVDLDAVHDDLAAVVQRALEPAHLSVWMSSHPGSTGGR
jgi:hypothetical protein